MILQGATSKSRAKQGLAIPPSSSAVQEAPAVAPAPRSVSERIKLVLSRTAAASGHAKTRRSCPGLPAVGRNITLDCRREELLRLRPKAPRHLYTARDDYLVGFEEQTLELLPPPSSAPLAPSPRALPDLAPTPPAAALPPIPQPEIHRVGPASGSTLRLL